MVLLDVDVGNTNVTFGLAPEGEEPFSTVWRMASRRDRTAVEWYALLRPLLAEALDGERAIEGVVLSSVVPSITGSIVRLARERFGVEPLLVSAALRLGIAVRTDSPAETGTDRIANAAAVYHLFGGPSIVVDLGTATKIEAITATGDYLGGVIAPGLGLALEMLAARAARLYAVELTLPSRAIGTNTVAAVQSGVVAGHLAMIEGMVRRVAAELGGVQTVALTGGYASALADARSVFTIYVPDLTLRGLRLIYHLNRSSG